MEKDAKHRQQEREKQHIYKTDESSHKPKFYVLDMFPYPSGAGLHVGHPKGYVATDVLARAKMLQGYNVLHPMGRDAFGLPAEQYAIKNKVNPTVSTATNVARYKQQLQDIGFTYDRDREVNTTDANFYKWTQWTFIKLYEHYYDHTAKKARPISELPILDGLSDEEKKQYIDNHRLAYIDYKPILRSVDLKTAIAQEDLDENGNCERTGGPVERRPMRQRVIRITDYADRLLEGLDELVERPDNVKQMQKHWIGKTEGTEFTMQIAPSRHCEEGNDKAIQDKAKNQQLEANSQQLTANSYELSIYTTRIDTVYGMSYIALAPEHPLIDQITTSEHKEKVDKYIQEAKSKGELQRTDLNKDKTGVFTGAFAINPFNKQPVPIRVADYVLGGYGTGAVMAVPAHDERDFAFAKKYDLPIMQSIATEIIGQGEKAPQKDKETIRRDVVDVIVENDKGEFLVLERPDGHKFFVGGGIEKGEEEIQAVSRELREETGYTDFAIQGSIQCSYIGYYGYRNKKQVNHKALGQFFHAKLISDKQEKSEVDEGTHTIQWIKKDDLNKIGLFKGHQIARNIFLNGPQAMTEKGILVQSGNYTGMTSDQAITTMQSRLTKQGIGGKKVQYKLQDRVFSRQRYRGEPIPMIHTVDGIQAVNESELPIKLPEVEHYEPTGTEEGPLANITDWVNTPEGKRETNTMPQRAGSSRYRLRYMDPKNPKNLVDPSKEKYRGQVDVYVGGMEHATRHLIYARFWHKFLYDIGVVSTSEPFKKLYGVGLVLAEDGRKMSKRRGNVVNPDDVIAEYGADAFRTYEMFMGPFENEVARNTAGVKGVKKFLDKIEKLSRHCEEGNDEAIQDNTSSSGATAKDPGENQQPVANSQKLAALLHKTIKKVTEDIENFRFNTAISQLMILVNTLSEQDTIDHQTMETLTLLIAPFAPHLAETLREKLGNTFSLFSKGKRPQYDERLLVDDMIKIAVQFNGKVRGTIQITPNATQDEVMTIIQNDPSLASRIQTTPQKIIYIPGKIINIIIT